MIQLAFLYARLQGKGYTSRDGDVSSRGAERVGGDEKTDDEKKKSQKRRDHETFVKSRT